MPKAVITLGKKDTWEQIFKYIYESEGRPLSLNQAAHWNFKNSLKWSSPFEPLRKAWGRRRRGFKIAKSLASRSSENQLLLQITCLTATDWDGRIQWSANTLLIIEFILLVELITRLTLSAPQCNLDEGGHHCKGLASSRGECETLRLLHRKSNFPRDP